MGPQKPKIHLLKKWTTLFTKSSRHFPILKMVKEGNNAMVATVVVVVGLLVLHCEIVKSETFVVGGKSGWTYGVQTWPYDKKFKSSDILGEFQFLLLLMLLRPHCLCLYLH